MALRRFGFIVKGPGYDPERHRVTMDSGQFSTQVAFVADADAAQRVVRQMVAAGVQLIELCGGFTREEASRLEREHAGGVPIGLVTYSPEQEARLSAMFG